MNTRTLFGYMIAALGSLWGIPQAHCQTIDLEFMDEESSEHVYARLKFVKGGKRVSRPRSIHGQGDWWLASPKFPINPQLGEFEFLVQRGPEFTEIRGGFTMEKGARDVVLVEIPRATDMHAEHWYSGDHFARISPLLASQWQRAEALDMVSTSWSQPSSANPPLSAEKTATKSRSKPSKKEDETIVESTSPDVVGLQRVSSSRLFQSEHSSVLVHGDWPTSPETPSAEASSESTSDKMGSLMEFLQNRQLLAGKVPELLNPWMRDVPILLSTQSIRSVQVLSTINRPESDEPIVFVTGSERVGIFGRVQTTRGKDRVGLPIYSPFTKEDRLQFKGGRGSGLLVQQLYWKMLDAGLRLTPTAGSGFGEGDTYLGYNRTYVFAEEPPTETQWWQAVSLGNTTVTNGPLLRTMINGLPPGSTQVSRKGEPIPLDISVSLSVREPVDYIDVIYNGETLYSAKLEEHYDRGEFPPLEIDRSGWLVVRVVTSHEKGYRFASTAPFYFEFDNQSRVSRGGVEFMQQWLRNAKMGIQDAKGESDRYEAWLDLADRFWDTQLQKANAP